MTKCKCLINAGPRTQALQNLWSLAILKAFRCSCVLPKQNAPGNTQAAPCSSVKWDCSAIPSPVAPTVPWREACGEPAWGCPSPSHLTPEIFPTPEGFYLASPPLV